MRAHFPSPYARGLAMWLWVITLLMATPAFARTTPRPTPIQAAPSLETVQRRAFDFFWRESHPKTGLTKDRAKNNTGPDAGKATVASSAATGYALAALPIGV